MVTIQDIERARKTIHGMIHPTPLLFTDSISDIAGRRIYLKLENLQKTGSFKIRGASNKISKWGSIAGRKGVIAVSAGNHAQGECLSLSEAARPSSGHEVVRQHSGRRTDP